MQYPCDDGIRLFCRRNTDDWRPRGQGVADFAASVTDQEQVAANAPACDAVAVAIPTQTTGGNDWQAVFQGTRNYHRLTFGLVNRLNGDRGPG